MLLSQYASHSQFAEIRQSLALRWRNSMGGAGECLGVFAMNPVCACRLADPISRKLPVASLLEVVRPRHGGSHGPGAQF